VISAYIVPTPFYSLHNFIVRYQALDYGASLWKSSIDFSDFLFQIDNYLTKKESVNAVEKIKSFYGIEDAEELLNKVKENLNHGNFKFIVLMDKLDSRLKDLILFINENSKFDIYAVEFDYYKYEELEIIIPKLYGTEVKKDIAVSKSKSSILNESDFENAYSATLYKPIVNSLVSLRDKTDSEVYFTGKYLNIKTHTNSGRAVTCNIHIEPEYEGGGINFWCNKEDESAVKGILSKVPGISISPDIKTKHGKVARWSFNNYDENVFRSVLVEFKNL